MYYTLRNTIMKTVRIISHLDIKGSHVVKGVHTEGLRVVGVPRDLARKYYDEGADEWNRERPHGERVRNPRNV